MAETYLIYSKVFYGNFEDTLWCVSYHVAFLTFGYFLGIF
jgi:hypothetical protein